MIFVLGSPIIPIIFKLKLEGCLVRGSSAPRAFPQDNAIPRSREDDFIDFSTEQMCGRAAIHDVTKHSVTSSDILHSDLSLAGA